jgi:cytochrome c-type biogenesis protein CcmH
MILPIGIAFTLPLVAGGVYLMVGEPAGIASVETRANPQDANQPANQASIEMMLDQLKERLVENPDDARGWSILARSSMQMQRYDDAAVAFARLNELTPDDPEVLVQYADALAMQAGGVLAGRPTELLEQALRVDPNQPQGLWLAGMAAQHRGDFEPAMARYSRLLPLLDADPDSRAQLLNMMRNLVQEARSAGVELAMPDLAGAIPPAVGGESTQQVPADESATLDSGALGDAALTVRVTLSEEIAASASPTDAVFVFARAIDGPPVPLAAARMQVSDLPFEVVLDDSQAMVPSMKLSSFERVDVVARVSKSGQATASSGDLEGQVGNVATDEDETLQLVISRRVP